MRNDDTPLYTGRELTLVALALLAAMAVLDPLTHRVLPTVAARAVAGAGQ